MDIRYLPLLSVVVVNFKVKKIPDFMGQGDRKKKKKIPKFEKFSSGRKKF